MTTMLTTAPGTDLRSAWRSRAAGSTISTRSCSTLTPGSSTTSWPSSPATGPRRRSTARPARRAQLPALLARVRDTRPDYLGDLEWLTEQRDRDAFVSVADYRRGVLGDRADTMAFRDDMAVTLEVSSLQYFPWVVAAARRAIADRSLMPGRWIRVRKMKEQEADGDLAAVAAAMQIIGASVRGDPRHQGHRRLQRPPGRPATITGYFGGVGQPNHHPCSGWTSSCTTTPTYGVRQVLNLNPGTVLVGYLLHRLGVDIEFKISVFMGNDNPFAGLWTLLRRQAVLPRRTARPRSSASTGATRSTTRPSRSPPRSGGRSGFEDVVRFEHHITETWKSIVRQPYNRRDELVELADHVPNISAKHEGGDPEVDAARPHPSDILDYFRDKSEVIASGDWDALRARLHGQARRHQPHRAGADRARPQLRGGAQPAPLTGHLSTGSCEVRLRKPIVALVVVRSIVRTLVRR